MACGWHVAEFKFAMTTERRWHYGTNEVRLHKDMPFPDGQTINVLFARRVPCHRGRK